MKVVLAAAMVLVAGCVPNEGAPDGPATITVDSSALECRLSADTAPSGTLVFDVTNSGDEVTEFYLLAADGLRIIAEVENIGPQITRQLAVTAAPGEYLTACKPGMVGAGIRAPFTVTDSGAPIGATGDLGERLAAASAAYVSYVEDQTAQLLAVTQAFAELYVSGQDDAARAAYAPARVHWERIEPVAESFGDLDPRVDLREADLEPGQEWTGWHVIEKDLWPPAPEANGGAVYVALSAEQRQRYADQLVSDTTELYGRVHAADFSLTGSGLWAIPPGVPDGARFGPDGDFVGSGLFA